MEGDRGRVEGDRGRGTTNYKPATKTQRHRNTRTWPPGEVVCRPNRSAGLRQRTKDPE